MLDPDLAPLLAELTQLSADSIEPSLLQGLRRRFPREEVEVALELSLARRKAAARFSAADQLLCDVTGVEQASGERPAGHKAKRFAPAPGRVLDLCCGIGGDTMALARVCDDLTAIDRSPVRAFMAGHNAGVASEVADITDMSARDAWLHIDPARRVGGKRLRSYADYVPGRDVVEPLLDRCCAAAVKLGPGVAWRDLPRRGEREIEFLGDSTGLLQAVMWCGELARNPGQHTATRLSDGLVYTARPEPALPVRETPGHYLLVPDPALERAQLVAPRIRASGAAELAPGLGILTSDGELDDPWFEENRIVATLPWRPRKIRDWLRSHDGGPVTVRTRAAAVHTDREQVALRGDGRTHYTLFGLRLGKKVACIVTV